ncbi:hypothetical protein GF339_03315 [candidate division KSB3 bacterium]|uniref:Uncharacterized protein n=1 Tax=candidate division KSB3 bacterium TaxID=2044937 RepID=A0A9D5JT84_9BACT|nr:hypothetical protein [candidate division KSB3 bacterium]MBD3323586.1 hypothetical protein [candidate division KSB3 bacterium]
MTNRFGMTVTGLAVYDAVYDVEDDLHIEDEEEYTASVDLRERFLDFTFDKLDRRIGKQQVVWGKFAVKIGKFFEVDDLTKADEVVEKTLLNYALAFERDLWDISWTAQGPSGNDSRL